MAGKKVAKPVMPTAKIPHDSAARTYQREDAVISYRIADDLGRAFLTTRPRHSVSWYTQRKLADIAAIEGLTLTKRTRIVTYREDIITSDPEAQAEEQDMLRWAVAQRPEGEKI